jgi:transposase
MEALVERCCGLDVHQAVIVACLLIGGAAEEPRRTIRKFGTFLKDLHELRDWLIQNGCTQVAMESTGVYWMPVYEVLEDSFKVVVGNARHIRNVPGRKTDVKDSEWIAGLLRHGLIASSFVPPRPLRDLRALVRYRRKLIQSRTSERNRLQKLLETANIKLATVLSDVFGVSGRLMLNALLDGRAKPEEIANLARGRLRPKLFALKQALDGRFTEEHRFLLGLQLRRLDDIEASIQSLDVRIQERMTPWAAEQKRLAQIPGVDAVVAASIIAEIGVDMGVFHGAGHLAAWAGVCPGNNESAGKSRRSQTRKGNVHLRTILLDAARAASRTKGTYLGIKYRRLKTRMDGNKAAMAIAHKILVAAFHMLMKGTDYKELGEDYFDRRAPLSARDRLVRRLERLGYEVSLELKAPGDNASDAQAVLAEARALQSSLRAAASDALGCTNVPPTDEWNSAAGTGGASNIVETRVVHPSAGGVAPCLPIVPNSTDAGEASHSAEADAFDPSPRLGQLQRIKPDSLRVLQPGSQAPRFAGSDFKRHSERDALLCPAGRELRFAGRFPVSAPRYALYKGTMCDGCQLKQQCTDASARTVKVSLARTAVESIPPEEERRGQ